MRVRSLCLGLVLLLSGCPQPPDDPDVPEPLPDTPAGDAPTDGDEDGVPRGRDCDDADPLVGTSGSRSCDGPCGPGVAACIDGMWRACEADTSCLCPTEGATRTMPCGVLCGMRTDTCTGGRWAPGASCDAEGECEAGTREMTNGPRCSVLERVCTAECTWGPETVLTPEGECEPGYIVCIARQRCGPGCHIETFTTDPRCP